jgi:hypothetical protein
MRSLLFFSLGAFVALGQAACGGASFQTVLDGGSSGDGGGSGGDDGGGGGGGGGQKDSGGGGGGDAGTCADQAKRLADLRAKAQACNGSSGGSQCGVSVHDACCPFTADASNQASIDAYNALFAVYQNQCGPFVCPAIACLITPSNACDSQTNLCR